MGASYTIEPLQPDAIPELSRFLMEGFQLPGAECLSPESLRWKYLAPPLFGQGPTSLVAHAGGRIVGHVGLCPRTFVVRGESPRTIPTTHPIDWIASPEHPSVGLLLLLRGFGTVETQYCMGETPVAHQMFQRIGFESRCRIEIFHKILRPLHRRLASRQGAVRKYLGAARDVLSCWQQRGKAPRKSIELRRVDAFGADVEGLLGAGNNPLVFSTRSPELLNQYLRYPSGAFSGWTVVQERQTIGMALLSLVREGGVLQGRIAECFLQGEDEARWHAALAALTRTLRDQSADEATCFSSTPWMSRALRQNGYTCAGTTEFLVRDRKNLLPRQGPYHITQLEADHAYLQ